VRFQCDEAEARKAEAEAHLAAATAQADALAAQRKAAGRSHRAARASVAASRGQVAALDSERELTQREVERVHTLGEYAAPSRRDELETRATRLDHEISAARASRRRTALQAAAAGHQESAAEAQRRAASESVRAAAAALRRAELRTEDCRLVAPKRAVVEAVHYEVGELAKAGAVILRLVRLDPVEVTFYLPNAQLSALAPGHEATIVADAWPDREFTGEVTTVATEAEFTPRNVQTREERARLVYPVEVSVPNPEHALRPGMPVEVTLEASR
jgi:HlyD family secretion protein